MLLDDKQGSDVTRPSEFASEHGQQGEDHKSKASASGSRMGDIQPLKAGSGEGRFLAHYEILEMIGQGGMGTVYKAKDTLLDRQVAVKVLSAHLSQDPELQDRFVREAKMIARMAHPNLPQIHFIGRAEGSFFFAMEWIDGETLEVLSKRGRVPPEKVLDIATQVASGLEFAHRAGIVHRDIKPSNIMLTSDGTAKILDFGIARSVAIESAATMTAGFVGTPDYASPEQARGEKVDERSDIYSLGATLYRLMSGKPPFEHETPLGVLTRRLVDPVPELPADMKCAPEVRQLIRRMMARDAKDRFQTSAELLAAIHEAYPGPVVPAGLIKRAFAFLTDLLLVMAPLAAIAYLFFGMKGYFLTTLLYYSIPGRLVLGLALLAWPGVYFVLVPRRWRATPGQRIQGIRLTARDGGDVTLWNALARVLVFWGPVCLAMALQPDWPPVITSRGLSSITLGGTLV
ncbi:MAG: protein kinase [Candidatus Eisenbacteria bacterium]